MNETDTQKSNRQSAVGIRQSGDTETLDKIAKILAQHVGKDQAITAADIAVAIGREPTYSRDIRRHIANNTEYFWDTKKLAVIAIPGGGFFIGQDYEEFEHYRNYLHALGIENARKLKLLDKLCEGKGLHLKKEGVEQ